MAIGALQTGYNTLYGKVAGLGTQNGQTRRSQFSGAYRRNRKESAVSASGTKRYNHVQRGYVCM